MATITVTTANDFVASDGLRSLREAVNSANATPEADTIVFAPALEGRTLTLTQGELQLTQDVTIDGDQDNNGSAGHPQRRGPQPDTSRHRRRDRRAAARPDPDPRQERSAAAPVLRMEPSCSHPRNAWSSRNIHWW